MTDTNNEAIVEATPNKQPAMTRVHDWFEITAYIGTVATLVVAGPLALLFAVNVYTAKIIEQAKFKLATLLIVVINVLPATGLLIYLATHKPLVNYAILILLWSIAGVLGLITIHKQSRKT
ncbi:MAG: hypothetical protein OEY89_11790 [Gammaproteobacteria bacterium]|nr:hypothetical protein [Gammaproteobacteria bacterium]